MKALAGKLIRHAAAIGFLALVPFASAQAGFCAVGDTCTFHLTNTNLIGVTADIEVLINNLSDPLHTQITVNFLSSNLSNTPLGIDQFGFNSDLAVSTQASGFSSASCPTGGPDPGCQIDGFGKFVSEVDSPGGTLLNFSFFLNGIETDFTDNANGGEFAAHVRFNGCSFFASDGANNGPTTPDTTCTVIRQVPEPGTLALVGFAIAGVGYARRRVQRR
jgi:hypothetical protein